VPPTPMSATRGTKLDIPMSPIGDMMRQTASPVASVRSGGLGSPATSGISVTSDSDEPRVNDHDWVTTPPSTPGRNTNRGTPVSGVKAPRTASTRNSPGARAGGRQQGTVPCDTRGSSRRGTPVIYRHQQGPGRKNQGRGQQQRQRALFPPAGVTQGDGAGAGPAPRSSGPGRVRDSDRGRGRGGSQRYTPVPRSPAAPPRHSNVGQRADQGYVFHSEDIGNGLTQVTRQMSRMSTPTSTPDFRRPGSASGPQQ
jgi:hypothetical protein